MALDHVLEAGRGVVVQVGVDDVGRPTLRTHPLVTVIDPPEEGVERLVHVRKELPIEDDALEVGLGKAHPVGPHHR